MNKWNISFLDANRNKCDIEIEISDRNAYKELTMHGQCAGHSGQCDDSIKGRTITQKNLLKLWDQYHLNGCFGNKKDLPEDIEDFIENLVETIKEEEEIREGESLYDLTDTQLIELIEEKIGYTGRDGELGAAFVKMFSLCENDLEDIDIDKNRCSIQGVDYLAGSDDEMDEEWNEGLGNCIDECMIIHYSVGKEIPSHIEMYFDRERWKDDARVDGRAHTLNHYDGCEYEMEINGTSYYHIDNKMGHIYTNITVVKVYCISDYKDNPSYRDVKFTKGKYYNALLEECVQTGKFTIYVRYRDDRKNGGYRFNIDDVDEMKNHLTDFKDNFINMKDLRTYKLKRIMKA